MNKSILLACLLALVATPALAKKSCEELKGEIEEKLKAKGVKSWTIDIVAKDEQKEGRIVGTCDGGARKLVYRRGK
ncbi:MAG TPA: DUF1161 domain-containing protein [Usitatibacteraceae bacterium]|nr:DUF1161 domain-containing protein [Usitatibacteraceae bacterium]